MLRAVQAGPTSSTGGGRLHGGQRSVSLEYQTCTSAYLFDTLVTGKLEATVGQLKIGRTAHAVLSIGLSLIHI